LAVAGALCLAGCAHTPPGATQQGLRQMIVQFTVRGRIDLNKHYFIALDLTGDTSQGPIPVVQRPWGNGWGAGRITHYVQMDAAQPGYAGIYKFRPDSSLLAADYLGRPLAVSIPAGGNTVEVALDLDLLQGAIPVTQQLNLNLISTDIIPIDPAFPGPKLVDALGPGAGNGFITLNTQSSRIYRNSDSLEPEGADNADIDLDLVDWQIEVRNR
jgi:hypothetical protein